MVIESYGDLGFIEIESVNPLNELQACVDFLSKFSSISSTPQRFFTLRLISVVVTRPILVLLIELLTLIPSPLSNVQTTGSAVSRIRGVILVECRFARQPDPTTPSTENENSCCSLADIQVFASLLARRTTCLVLSEVEWPEILDALSNVAQFEIEYLCVYKRVLSASECKSLGNLIQRCVHLTGLDIKTMYIEETHALAEGLAHAFHLREFSFEETWRTGFRRNHPALVDTVVGTDGNGMIRCLLSPQSQLRKLDLAEMHLDDRHFMAIVTRLPTLQLEHLLLTENKIQSHGVLEFARLLPRIKCLKTVFLNSNPWEDTQEGCQVCCSALLQGMVKNCSIEYLGFARDDRSPLPNLLRYYSHLNKAGRRILATSNVVPAGLWPFILQRAWKISSLSVFRVDSIHYFLQNRPALMHRQVLENSLKKNSRSS